MSWYAARSWRTARQVTADVFVVAWTVAWVLVSRLVHRIIGALAQPARSTASSAQKLVDDFRSAGDAVGGVPGAGATLRAPFDRAAESMLGVVTAANEQVVGIERVADLVGVLTVAIPVLGLVVVWLPTRVRFFTTARASRRYIDSAADLDLFALRAMATQPMPVLARISDDPVRAWREGDRRVIDALAEAELRRSGLLMPERLRTATRADG